MNGKFYFEQEPWDKALLCLQEEQLGVVAEVSVHGVCRKGEVESTAARWKTRLASLLGECTSEDQLRGEAALSYLAKYANNAIARLFFDDSSENLSENFEIVTQKALLVWKPDVHPQGAMQGSEANFIDCGQPYSVQLEVL